MDKNFAWAIIFILGIGIIASVAVKSVNNTDTSPLPAEDFDWKKPATPAPVKPQARPRPRQEVLPAVPTTYEQALKIAKNKKKDVLLFFGADWCKYCERMKSGTLKNSKVQAEMSKFVVYHVDTDKEKALAEKFGVSGIPVYIVLDANTERAKKTGQGYKDARSFERWLSGRDLRPDFMPDRRPPIRNPG